VGRHRQEDEDPSRSEPTQILPIVKKRPATASPLLLAAGGAALTLVLGVGGWALMGSRSGGDPLVFPWSGEQPSDIDVSVSMVPTVEPPVPSDSASPSPSASRPRVPKRSSPTPQTLLSSVQASPSRSTESLASLVTARVTSYGGWDGHIVANVEVRNSGQAGVTWTVDLVFDKTVDVDPPWNAKVQTVDDRHLRFTAVRTLSPGDTVRFGFIAGYFGRTRPSMMTCTVDGRDFPCSAD